MVFKIEIIGNGKYAVSKHQQYVDKTGQLVRVTKEDPLHPIPIGKAYGFFYCDASKQEIEETLPTIRELVETPSELELNLLEITQDPQVYPGKLELSQIVSEAKAAGMRYFLEASCPNATNVKTGDELSTILNQAYQSPLYQADEPFKGAIVYEDKGKYIFRE